MSYKSVLHDVKKARDNRLSGNLNTIPFLNLPRFSNVVTGIEKAYYTIISANTKVGKTTLADYLYLHSPIEWLYQQHKAGTQGNVDIEILYFSLEESKREKYTRLFTKTLSTIVDNEIITRNKLFSKHKDYILPVEILDKLSTKSDYLDFFDSKVTFIEDVRTAEQFESYMLKAMVNPKRGKFVNGEYIETNPEKYTIVIFDNYNVIANSDKYTAINNISAGTMITLRNIYKCTCVGIVQQAPDQESRNAIQANQVEPSISGIQHNKAIAQDSNLNLGLFAPDRYEHIRTRLYRQYTVAKFGDYLRFIMVLPSRNGGGGAVCPIFFNGGTGEIFELPRPDDKVGLSKIYAYIDKLKKLEGYAATD